MRTVRTRLTVWYTAAMAATLVAFGLVLYLVDRPDAYTRLDAGLRLEADVVAAVLTDAFRSQDSVIVEVDPRSGSAQLVVTAPASSASPGVATLLESVPDYVMVLGAENEPPLFLSENPSDDVRYAQLIALADTARLLLPEGGHGTANLADLGNVRFHIRPMEAAGNDVRAVVAGVSTERLALRPERLLSAMLLIAPLILAASLGLGYVLARSTLKPVDQIVDEVQAISDGRSLHRRLAEPIAGDEVARLTITLNQMLARLESSFVTLRRFTADASHELKTPLTVLRAGVESAMTHPMTPAAVMALLEETLIEVKRMTELVDSMLMLARAEEGRAPLHLEDVDLRETLGDLVETAGILGEQARVDVSVAVPAHPLIVSVDPSRIRQLLMNLVTNAVKYTPAGGSVSVESATLNGTVVLTVRDSGVGIAPGHLPHVFDRFWRADLARSRTGQRPGAGLGLAICKWIAEAHGGGIEVQSRVGHGTTMTVKLPMSET